MEEIATALNTTPRNIYHYVSSKEELAYQCYLRSCKMRRAQLDNAFQPNQSGLQNILGFLQSLLTEGQGRPAVLAELGALKSEWAKHVRSLQKTNVQQCQRMIAKGIEDGSIAPSNPSLTGIGIMSIVEWMSFWYTDKLPYSRQEITESICDLVVNGIAINRSPVSVVPKLEQPYPKQEDIDPFDKQAIVHQKIQLFLRIALQSFNSNGVKATSIDEISEQLNLTKGAFYHYFKNKEELLYQCYERALAFNRVPLKHVADISLVDREVLTRRSLFERHISELGPFPAYHNVTFLSGARSDQLFQELNDFSTGDERNIKKAIEQKYFREVNTYIAEKIRSALLNWFPIWYSSQGSATPSEIADNHSQLFLNGLKP